MTYEPTPQQGEVIESVASDEACDLVVTARAGSGKTSTILRAIAARPWGKSAMLCAFNRDIAKELQARTLGMSGVQARTLHGIGKHTIDSRFPGMVIDRHRERRHAAEVCGADEPPLVLEAVADLAAAVKECAPDKATDHDEIRRVGAMLGLMPSGEELGETSWTQTGILRATAAVVERAVDLRNDATISYADMLYVPLALRLSPRRFDIVVVDELQDLNRAQIKLALRMRADGARFIGLGDQKQTLYGFRGASHDTIDRLRVALHAREIKLTVTHRCARAIVREAQAIVPDLEPAARAVEGIVRDCAWGDLATSATAGDFVIGRNNAILVLACLRMMRAGARARVVGSDLGPTMSALVKRLARGTNGDMATMAERIAAWQDREIRTAKARKSEQAEAVARDKAAVLDAILDDCDTIDEMHQRIGDLFVDDGRGFVKCSTVHKAKGLEADRVWMLDDSFHPPRKDDTPSKILEEENLRYVAMTRARFELVHVRG